MYICFTGMICACTHHIYKKYVMEGPIFSPNSAQAACFLVEDSKNAKKGRGASPKNVGPLNFGPICFVQILVCINVKTLPGALSFNRQTQLEVSSQEVEVSSQRFHVSSQQMTSASQRIFQIFSKSSQQSAC